MSRIALLFVVLMALVQLNCKESTESSGKNVYVSIDVESAFQNDLVRVQLDNALLLESAVTTDNTISLAWSSGLRRLSGSTHTLLFSIVDQGIHKEFNIGLTNDTTTVVIRFNRATSVISIDQLKGLSLRD